MRRDISRSDARAKAAAACLLRLRTHEYRCKKALGAEVLPSFSHRQAAQASACLAATGRFYYDVIEFDFGRFGRADAKLRFISVGLFLTSRSIGRRCQQAGRALVSLLFPR